MSDESHKFTYLGPTAVDPRDAEIERLKVTVARLKAQRLLLAKLASDDVLYVSYDVVTARKLRDEVLEAKP